jgi:hypothetical protein
MVNATVVISESNTSAETVTDSPSNLNFGSNDQANLTPATYPISPGDRSYEKWTRHHITDNSSSNVIDNHKVWISNGSNPQANATIYTNCTTNVTNYEGAETFNGTTGPSDTDRSGTYHYDQLMPTSEPSRANFGWGGSLNGTTNGTGFSDYVIIQLAVGAGATAGSNITLSYQYDETG